MGLLHNVAILNSGVPPDRSEGSVREWITTDNYTLLPLGERETGIGFQMRIEERIVGRATLVFDRETGLAVRRDQTVLFSNGKMEVKEYYPSIRIFPTDSLNTQQLPAQ
jgi:hypothetical protein